MLISGVSQMPGFFTNGNVASDIPFALSGQDNLVEVDLTYARGQFTFTANNNTLIGCICGISASGKAH